TVRIAALPEGLDPDKFVRERGTEAFQQEIEKSLRYDQLFLEHISQSHDLKSPNGRLAASHELQELLQSIANPFERDHIMNRFASVLGVSTHLLAEQYRSRQKSVKATATPKPEQEKLEGVEKRLLQIFLMSPEIATQVFPEFDPEDFEDLTRADLFRQLQQMIQPDQALQTAEIIHAFPHETQDLLTSLVMDQEAPAPSPDLAREWVAALRLNRKQRQMRNLGIEIEDAKRTGDNEKLDLLLQQK